MAESDIQRDILSWLTRHGVFHWRVALGPIKHAGVGRRANPMSGHPDIAGILPGGRYFAVEVKTTEGRISPLQKSWLDRLNAGGAMAFVVRNADEIAEKLLKYL